MSSYESRIEEYLRRNTNLCKLVGAKSYIDGTLLRAKERNLPKWCIKGLKEASNRLTDEILADFAKYRDQAHDV